MKVRYAVSLAVAALVVGAFVGVGLPQRAHAVSDATERTISVTGTGIVNVVPDRAVLTFGVDTSATTAGAALSANSAAMRKVLAALRAAGIDTKDLQTSQVSLSPSYDENEEKIIGFDASNSVTVIVRTISKAGALIDVAVKAGANQVDGPSLQRSDQGELGRKALAAAMADARANAQAIAAAAGLTLGKVITANVSDVPPPSAFEAKSASPSAPDDTPIEPGQTAVQATVSVTFEVS
jgi:uncharacterized protein YggE